MPGYPTCLGFCRSRCLLVFILGWTNIRDSGCILRSILAQISGVRLILKRFPFSPSPFPEAVCPRVVDVSQSDLPSTLFKSYISLTTLVCILPFPALIKISEPRIRMAVCGVYSLAGLTIIFSILRAVLLGLNRGASLEHISILTMIEVMVIVVLSCLPGMSSTFTRKYIHHDVSYTESGSAIGQRKSQSSYGNFAQLKEPGIELHGVRSEASGERL
jgi:hypothetical protein